MAVARIVDNQTVADTQEIRTLIQQEMSRSVFANLIRQLQGGQQPVYTVATMPAASTANQGTIICVSDAAAGSKFQGSVGGSWVSLG